MKCGGIFLDHPSLGDQNCTMNVIPDSHAEAEAIVDQLRGVSLLLVPKASFVRAWWAVAYLNPGLHPDGFDEDGSGWLPELRPFAEEAWRRFELGDLTDEELYPADAAWAALYDGMEKHTDEESDRRNELRAFQVTAQDS